MKNFIVRSITSVFFVATIVVSFLNPLAMVFLFAIVTGMTIWELVGLVNERPYVQVNRFISTVAGVYFFLAMAGHCSGRVTSDTVFIPYLITIIYLMVAELYLKAKDPINNWAYTMLPQLYVALPFSMINVLAFPPRANFRLSCPSASSCSSGSTMPAPIASVRSWAATSCFRAFRRARAGRAASAGACWWSAVLPSSGICWASMPPDSPT